MATSMNFTLFPTLLCLVAFVQLDIVGSIPIQISSSNNCTDQTDCSINVDYIDNTRNINLLTSNDSVVQALPEIIELLGESSNQNELVSLMENIMTMLSSMMQLQQDNHQQLVNMVQQSQLGQVGPQPSIQPSPMITDLQTSVEPELVGELQTSPEPEFQTSPEPEHQTSEEPEVQTSPEPEHQTSEKPEVKTSPEPEPMQDCSDAPSTGQYNISLQSSKLNPVKPFLVVCDMDTTSGGWIVIQRRFNGSVSFYRNWADYENGFGSLDGEFWLGLSKMHLLTNCGTWKLRFDLEDFEGNRAYAEYDNFEVGNSASFYRLTIRYYSGSAGDAMIAHHDLNGMAFTTKDQDHDQTEDRHCGTTYRSGWWHNDCAYSGVNGLYLGQGGNNREGMSWYQWKDQWSALKKTEMKIKRVD